MQVIVLGSIIRYISQLSGKFSKKKYRGPFGHRIKIVQIFKKISELILKMEEACARLREEIESLQTENQKLERIYLANGISRISKSDNEEQLAKWVDETLKNSSSKTIIEDSLKN